MEVGAYLDRIGMAGAADREVGPALLCGLGRAHVRAVPFENLDVLRGEPIVLDLERLYEKVVERGRGGFCYELNAPFAWLLSELGFEVATVSARVRHDGGEFGPEFDHMALVVGLDRDYLVDVGFGDFARRPLPLSGEPRRDPGGTYRVRARGETGDCDDGETYDAERRRDGKWTTVYRFTTRPRSLPEFGGMCRYHQSPESHFTDGLQVTRATEDGRITLLDSALVVTEGGEKRRRPVDSAVERDRLLRERFGIEVG